MRQYQLRSYYFTSAAAAANYILRWQPHVNSLKIFDVGTHGFFSVKEEPARVVALVSYPPGADPDAVVRAYMQSEGFRADMAGFDMSQMERVETLLLVPGEGSPLA
ncbi:NIPSNAP family containing protein [Pantoea vagans]|uniref:NIPSNAP family containing protein n=1 Tax=Pantoea vagans TaxID=470934 RepID=UPI0023B0FC55|nr:NIPSNAP family containing protein [Pantoea vagans]MDE8559363.1 NIPSNAP family containing protein [Pantoea vagans]MDE8579221.1 NIPSNAP family containing protein [Pantoea vagans]